MLDRNYLVEILRLLASTSDCQIKAFPKFANPADELATLFEDLEDFYPHEFTKVGETSSLLRCLQRLFDELQKNNKEVWTSEALSSYAKWNEIRSTALKTLKALGEEYAPPDLTGMVSFVQGKNE